MSDDSRLHTKILREDKFFSSSRAKYFNASIVLGGGKFVSNSAKAVSLVYRLRVMPNRLRAMPEKLWKYLTTTPSYAT
jgi:hypothetical protein